MSVKQRLKEYIKHKDLSIYFFEKSIGASNAYINSITKGIGGKYLEIIRDKYDDLNITWLLSGEGEMLQSKTLPNNSDNKSLEKKVELLEEKIIGLRQNFKMLYDQLLFLQNSWIAEKNKNVNGEEKKLG